MTLAGLATRSLTNARASRNQADFRDSKQWEQPNMSFIGGTKPLDQTTDAEAIRRVAVIMVALVLVMGLAMMAVHW
jgi:hypothetical protein